ncbi:MAG: dienelactone hydrolase family protein [Lactobacillaceae bacterium]|jgi:phospholipase/carboxylesterase|nr:dienelactone hydrolase family protein [Lactobacillaceae bacterium]
MDMNKINQIRHAYVSGRSDLAPILLLHGTGGDEMAMLEVGAYLGADNPKLSIRGRVLEGRAPRYFKRDEDWNFDLDSLRDETTWLLDSIKTLAKFYQLDLENMIVVGFSNGANIAAHAMLTREDAPFKTGVFFHAMELEKIDQPKITADTHAMLTFGANDPIVSEESFTSLADSLRLGGVKISVFETASGHALDNTEIQAAKLWLEGNDLLDVD